MDCRFSVDEWEEAGSRNTSSHMNYACASDVELLDENLALLFADCSLWQVAEC